VGLSPERIQIFWCSAAEGQVFQENIERITETIKKLGSNPLKEAIKKGNEKQSLVGSKGNKEKRTKNRNG